MYTCRVASFPVFATAEKSMSIELSLDKTPQGSCPVPKARMNSRNLLVRYYLLASLSTRGFFTFRGTSFAQGESEAAYLSVGAQSGPEKKTKDPSQSFLIEPFGYLLSTNDIGHRQRSLLRGLFCVQSRSVSFRDFWLLDKG